MNINVAKVMLSVFLILITLGSLRCMADTPTQVNENQTVTSGGKLDKDLVVSIDDTAKVLYTPSDEKTVVASNTEFAFEIFRELIKDKEESDKNIFISPFSLSAVLAMTYNGAQGSTKTAMENVLQIQGKTLDEINKGYLDLIDNLDSVDEKIKIQIANSIWIEKGFDFQVKTDFKQRIAQYFDSEIFARDFTDQKSIDEINGWVSQATEGKIDYMTDSLRPDTLMLLINAIYFKGTWTYEFDESLTRKEDFFLSDANTVSVDMMSRIASFDYYKGDNFEAARLPYSGNKLAMYVFLPNKNVSLDSFVESLNQQQVDEYISLLAPEDVEVKLPRFKIEYGTKHLNDALINLGMGIAFSGEADFSDMASAPLFIDSIDHKSMIEVNERGSEATAATVVMIVTSVPSTFSADRPFFFVIRDDHSGSILFMGKVIDPTRT